MDGKRRKYVEEYIYRKFLIFMDSCDATLFAESLAEDVVSDIEETADENFNGADIEIAITRVLKARLGL